MSPGRDGSAPDVGNVEGTPNTTQNVTDEGSESAVDESTSQSGLYVPDLADDVDCVTAALACAAAGFFVGPVRRATKNPGSVYGPRWQNRTTRDPEQIVASFAGTDHGLFLHVGRSGAVVFDVDHPENLPDVLRDAFADHPGPMQTTRIGDTVRGHYVYRCPPGRTLGNGLGRLPAGWGDVRGENGVIIVAPSVHAAADEGGRYRWARTGSVPQLPGEIAACLTDAAPASAPVSDGEVSAFAATYARNLDRRPLAAWCNHIRREVEGGASRHTTTMAATTAAMEEAASGIYPAGLALHRLREVFVAAAVKPGAGGHQGTARTEAEAHREFDGIARAAVARARDGLDTDAVIARVRRVCPTLGEGNGTGAANTAALAELGGITVPPTAGAPSEPAVPHPSPNGSSPSVATLLTGQARAAYRFGVSVKGEPFAVPLAGPNVARMLRGAGGSLRSELAADYFDALGKAAPQNALTDALSVLEGMAKRMPPETLQLRSANVDGSTWVDLGDTAGRALQITRAGWWVRDTSPVLFYRTALTAALPEPIPGGDLATLWELVNVAEQDKPLVLAWLLFALLHPEHPCPVLALLGEQGTGKSTASKRVAALVDPANPQVRRSPRDGESWVSAATGSRVVALDNVSVIPEWLSDALCRAVTGDGDVRRALYTDGDHVVIAFRRAVILNGIDLGAVRDDLADRLLTVRLSRLTGGARARESVLEAAWAEAHPRVLAALLDLAVRVFAAAEHVVPARLPRMADFAVTLAAVDHVLGTTGSARYADQAAELAADAVGSDPVLVALVATVTTAATLTAGELLALLTPSLGGWTFKPHGWPKDSRAMTAELRRKAPSLRLTGWEVEPLPRGGKDKVIRWRLTPPVEGPPDQGAGRA